MAKSYRFVLNAKNQLFHSERKRARRWQSGGSCCRFCLLISRVITKEINYIFIKILLLLLPLLLLLLLLLAVVVTHPPPPTRSM